MNKKYQITKIEGRELAIRRNRKNSKRAVLAVKKYKRNGTPVYKTVSKNYTDLSNIAPVQAQDTYAQFLAHRNDRAVILLNNNKAVKVKKINYKNRKKAGGEAYEPQMINIGNGVVLSGMDFSHEYAKKKAILIPNYSLENEMTSLIISPYGEFLHSPTTKNISATYAYIGKPDANGMRLAKLKNADTELMPQYVYVDKNFQQHGEPFRMKVRKTISEETSLPCLKFEAELVYDGTKCYFIDRLTKQRISRKFNYLVGEKDGLFVVEFGKNKRAILDKTYKVVSPYFAKAEAFNESYALTISPQKREVVLWNPTATEVDKQQYVPISNAILCPKHNLVLGDIDINGQKQCVVINSQFPTNAYQVNPHAAVLALNYLNGKRLNPHLVDIIINHKEVLESTLEAINDCMNQSLPEDKRKPVSNRYNPSSKFLTRLNNTTKRRMKRYQEKSDLLDEKFAIMTGKHNSLIIGCEEEMAELDKQILALQQHKKQKQSEYELAIGHSEDELDQMHREIDYEKSHLAKKGKTTRKYQKYIVQVREQNPNAQDELENEVE